LETNPRAGFVVVINSAFDGEAGITQLANGYSTNADIGDSTTNTWQLDNWLFYPFNTNGQALVPVIRDAPPSVTNNWAILGDSPSIRCAGTTEIHKDYRDFVRFSPSGGDSIFVTLGIVNWHVYATAVPSGNNFTLISTNCAIDLDYTDWQDPPQWEKILYNP